MFDTNKAKGPIKKNIAPNLKRLRGLWKNDPDQIFPVAGASIIPNIGIVLSINAILTVKFPSLLINPLVPSSGSTNQYGPLGFWFSEWKVSSEIIGMSGVISLSDLIKRLREAWLFQCLQYWHQFQITCPETLLK